MHKQSNHYNEALKSKNTILAKTGHLVDGVFTGASALEFSVNETKNTKEVRM